LNPKKVKASKADLWVFVMQSFAHKTIDCVVIPPKTLVALLKKNHGPKKLHQTYMWVRNDNTCWEARGLSKTEKLSLADGDYENEDRHLTGFLNNWGVMKKTLGK